MAVRERDPGLQAHLKEYPTPPDDEDLSSLPQQRKPTTTPSPMPNPELFESYLVLPPEERAKVDAHPKGKMFRAFAGLPVTERGKFLKELKARRADYAAARQPATVESETLQQPDVLLPGVLGMGRVTMDPVDFLTGAGMGALTAGLAKQGIRTAVSEAMRSGAAFQTGGLSQLPSLLKNIPAFVRNLRQGMAGEPKVVAPPAEAPTAAPPPRTPVDVPSKVSGVPMPPSPIQRLALPPASGLPASQSATRQALVDRLSKARAERLKPTAPVAEHLEQLRETVAPKTKDPLIDALKSLGYKAGEANQLAKEHPEGTMEERIKSVFMAEGQKLAPAETPPVASSKPSRAASPAVAPSTPTAGMVEGPVSVERPATVGINQAGSSVVTGGENLLPLVQQAEKITGKTPQMLWNEAMDALDAALPQGTSAAEKQVLSENWYSAYLKKLTSLDTSFKVNRLLPEGSETTTQPKLFQTQATMPPEGLQAKAPQVEHGDLPEGFKKPEPEAPKLPLGDKSVSGGAPKAVEDILAATQAGVASPMVQPLVHTKALKQAVEAVTDFMTEHDLHVDPNGPRINVQLMQYIADGKVRPQRLLEWFERRGLDFDEIFSQAGMETASESGRLLNIWSRAAQVLGRSRGPAAKLLGEKVQRMTDTIRVQTGSPDVVRKTIEGIVGESRLKDVDGILATLGKMDRTDRLAINRFLGDIAKKSLSSKLFEFYINGLISSPVALQAKLVGDLIQKSFMLTERKIASTIDPAIAVLSRRPRERFAGEASADFFGWASMFTEGFRRGMKAYATEMLDENALDASRMPAIHGQIGRAIRIPGRLFNAITVTARTMAERGELAARAYRLAMSEKLTGSAFDRRVAELMEHPPASFLMAMEQAGKAATYTQPFGPLGKTFMRTREAHPFLKFVVPIVKIPVNIAKGTLEHTPLNLVRIANMARKGELAGGEISDELAKPILGSMILGGFALAAHQGLVTGHGPLNPKDKAMKEATGWRPDSMFVNGNYYPLRKLGVLGNLLSIAADMVETAKRGETVKAEQLALTAAMSISRVVTDPPFVRGVKNFADFVHEPLRYGEYWLKTFESSFVPSIVGRAASAIDPVKRETTLATAPLARIPFASRLLPPVRTPFGEEATYGADTAFSRFAGLIPRSSVKPGTEVEAELSRLGIGLGRPSKGLSLGLKGELSIGERKIARNRDEQALFETTAGRIAKETLRQIISTPGYQQAPDAVKRAIIHMVVTKARLGVSRQIVPQALQQLMETPR